MTTTRTGLRRRLRREGRITAARERTRSFAEIAKLMIFIVSWSPDKEGVLHEGIARAATSFGHRLTESGHAHRRGDPRRSRPLGQDQSDRSARLGGSIGRASAMDRTDSAESVVSGRPDRSWTALSACCVLWVGLGIRRVRAGSERVRRAGSGESCDWCRSRGSARPDDPGPVQRRPRTGSGRPCDEDHQAP